MAGNADKGAGEHAMKQRMDNLDNSIGAAWDKLGNPDAVVAEPEKDEEGAQDGAEDVLKENGDQDPPEKEKGDIGEGERANQASDDGGGDEPDPKDDPKDEPEEEEEVDEDPLSVLKDDDEPTGDDEDGTHTRADDDDSKEELDEIRNDPHTNPKTKKSIDRLLGKISAEKKAARELQEKLNQLETKLKAAEEGAESKVDPIAEQEREELKMLRRRVNVEADPEIAQRFDTRIKAVNETLNGIIDSSFVEDDAAKIKNMGIENFARTNPKDYKKFIERLEDDAPLDADTVRASIGELRSLRAQKQGEIERLTKESDEYWAEREKQSKSGEEQQKARVEAIKKIRSAYESELINGDKHFMTIDTSNLSGEEKAIAERENKRRAAYQANIKKRIHANTLEEQQETLYHAAMLPVVADRLRDFKAENKKLKAELETIRKKQTIQKPKSDPKPPPPKKPTSFEDGLRNLTGIGGLGRPVIPQ